MITNNLLIIILIVIVLFNWNRSLQKLILNFQEELFPWALKWKNQYQALYIEPFRDN